MQGRSVFGAKDVGVPHETVWDSLQWGKARAGIFQLIGLPRVDGILSSRAWIPDFPGSTMTRNLPPSAGNMGSVVGGEDSTCYKATKPMRHNCWTHVLQILKLVHLEPVLCKKRSHHNEKPVHSKRKEKEKEKPHLLQLENAQHSNKEPATKI